MAIILSTSAALNNLDNQSQNPLKNQLVTGAVKTHASRPELFLAAKNGEPIAVTERRYADSATAEYLGNRSNPVAQIVCGKSPAGLKLASLGSTVA